MDETRHLIHQSPYQILVHLLIILRIQLNLAQFTPSLTNNIKLLEVISSMVLKLKRRKGNDTLSHRWLVGYSDFMAWGALSCDESNPVPEKI